MKILACLGFFVMLFWHSTSGSRITFRATPDNIFSTVTKSLQLRCAVESSDLQALLNKAVNADNDMAKQQIMVDELENDSPVDSDPIIRRQAVTHPTNTLAAVTGRTVEHTMVSGTPTDSSITQAEVSHITSIIVSRVDVTTGKWEEVASVSSFDLPVASTDLDKISVEGQTGSSPESGELGYLLIEWVYPVRYQASIYTCEVYALDSTHHPVSLTKRVEITSAEPSISELTAIIAQNDKSMEELRQIVANLTEKVSELSFQNPTAIEDLYNITERLQNKTDDIKAQNIQIGIVTCVNSVRSYSEDFPKPFKNIPQVFFSANSFSSTGSYAAGEISVGAWDISLTRFTYICSYTGIYAMSNVTWIAIDK